MIKRLALFILLLLLWGLLTWTAAPLTSRFVWEHWLPGVGMALLTVLLLGHAIPEVFGRLLNPRRLFWLVIYIFVFAFHVVRANFDVAWRLLHPAMPIQPGIVRVRTNLKTKAGIAMLSNAIALTPGTLPLHAGEDGMLYVHWLNVKTHDSEAAARRIAGRFEWLIRRILE